MKTPKPENIAAANQFRNPATGEYGTRPAGDGGTNNPTMAEATPAAEIRANSRVARLQALPVDPDGGISNGLEMDRELWGLEPFDTGGHGTERLIGSVVDGSLSRGVASADKREAVEAWMNWSIARAKQFRLAGDYKTSQKYADFTSGVEASLITFYERKFVDDYPYESGSFDSDGPHPDADIVTAWRNGKTHDDRRDSLTEWQVEQAFKTAATVRASRLGRERWMHRANDAPTENDWRGYIVAGSALAGTDAYWGLRDDPDALIV